MIITYIQVISEVVKLTKEEHFNMCKFLRTFMMRMNDSSLIHLLA